MLGEFLRASRCTLVFTQRKSPYPRVLSTHRRGMWARGYVILRKLTPAKPRSDRMVFTTDYYSVAGSEPDLKSGLQQQCAVISPLASHVSLLLTKYSVLLQAAAAVAFTSDKRGKRFPCAKIKICVHQIAYVPLWSTNHHRHFQPPNNVHDSPLSNAVDRTLSRITAE